MRSSIPVSSLAGEDAYKICYVKLISNRVWRTRFPIAGSHSTALIFRTLGHQGELAADAALWQGFLRSTKSVLTSRQLLSHPDPAYPGRRAAPRH